MMSRISRFLAGIMSVLPGFGPLFAAEKETPAVHFTVFALRPVEPMVFQPEVDAQPQPLKFYPTARSPEYTYTGEMPLLFTDARSGEVVASAAIPASIAKAVLIFAALPSNHSRSGPRYQIHVLDDGPLRHGRSGLSFVNLSGLDFDGRLGSRRITLGAGVTPSFQISGNTELLLETTRAGRRYRSYSQSIALASGERALLVLFPPYYTGSLEVQARLLIDEPPGAPAAGISVAGARARD